MKTNPLVIRHQSNGIPRLQGVFTLRDQDGFPLDMSYEMAKERGWEIDWVEALADAARQSILKYDSLIKEIAMLEPNKVESSKTVFMCGLMSCEGDTFIDKANNLYKQMHNEN